MGEKVHRNSIHRSLYNIVSKEVLGSCGSFSADWVTLSDLRLLTDAKKFKSKERGCGRADLWTVQWVGVFCLEKVAHPEFWSRPQGVLVGPLSQACPVLRGSKQTGRWGDEGCRQILQTVSVRVGLTLAELVGVVLAHRSSLQTSEWLMTGVTLLITLAGATAPTWHVPSDFFSTNLAFSCKCILC